MKFFNELSTTRRRQVSKTIIDVGAGGDCGFLSVAASLVDGALDNNAKVDGPLACIFAEIDAEAAILSPQKRLMSLIRNYGFDHTLSVMALILRRLAVKEMVSDPGKYQGPFVEAHQNTDPNNMLAPGTFIDETAMAALSAILNIPIELSIVNRDDLLRLRLVYNDSDETNVTPIISLCFDAGKMHYQPQIINETAFRALQRMNVNFDEITVKAASDVMPSSDEICVKIAAENLRMVQAFEDAKGRLEAMVELDGAKKIDLLTLYCEAIPSSDYLSGHLNHVSKSTKRAIEKVLISDELAEENVESHDEHVVKELIHAIARAISIGHVPETVLDNQIRDRKGVFTK